MSGQSVPPTTIAGSQPPPLKIPDAFTEATLATELGQRLSGPPAAGGATLTRQRAAGQVIWVDAGSEVMVHLASVQTHIADGLLLVAVDFECDQTGRTTMVASFAMNSGSDAAGLFSATDELPRGNGLLAARWGRIYQDAVWAALTGLISDHAAERKLFPLGLICAKGMLTLRSGTPLIASQLASGGVPGVTR